LNRRDFLRISSMAAAGTVVVPTIVPSTVFGKNAPSNRIQIGQIGCGRIAHEMDMLGVLAIDSVRYVAISDVDSKRMEGTKPFIENYYQKKYGGKEVDVKLYGDFREMLLNPEIDAVVLSLPDHWHAQPAMMAAMAGKHIYLQKPASLTIKEGRMMSDMVHRSGVTFQIGSQQRSASQFRYACELVRNGRLGKLHTIEIGLPGDPAGDDEPVMPVPKNLNYDMWLGSTPEVYYTEKRVHPQADFSRPGWLRCEQFGAGMITGWGAHHLDIAHWGMGTEYSGPVEIEAKATFPTHGLWDVHGDFEVKARYANGVTMYVSGDRPNGVKFEGTEGWIFVTRGNYQATKSDPVTFDANRKALDASDPKLLTSVIGPDEIHLPVSNNHYVNWIEAIRNRTQPIAPVEVAHRSCSACLLSHIAMKIPKKLAWDPVHERFTNSDEGNAMLERPQRKPYGVNYL
jgi:myo-inositol 2-dehydrogenase/D-chiro-inositol 1-dehydrogenase